MDSVFLVIGVPSLLNCAASPNKPIDREGEREREREREMMMMKWVSDGLCFFFHYVILLVCLS